MEVLLFALFFISALIFFIAGKDDFGRTENKLIIKDIEKEKGKEKDEEEENIKPADKNYRNVLFQKASRKLDAFVNDEIFGGRDQVLFRKFLNKNVNLFNELKQNWKWMN